VLWGVCHCGDLGRGRIRGRGRWWWLCPAHRFHALRCGRWNVVARGGRAVLYCRWKGGYHRWKETAYSQDLAVFVRRGNVASVAVVFPECKSTCGVRWTDLQGYGTEFLFALGRPLLSPRASGIPIVEYLLSTSCQVISASVREKPRFSRIFVGGICSRLLDEIYAIYYAIRVSIIY